MMWISIRGTINEDDNFNPARELNEIESECSGKTERNLFIYVFWFVWFLAFTSKEFEQSLVRQMERKDLSLPIDVEERRSIIGGGFIACRWGDRSHDPQNRKKQKKTEKNKRE